MDAGISNMMLWAISDSLQGYLTDTFALAAVALFGYLFGRRAKKPIDELIDLHLHQELSMLRLIAFSVFAIDPGFTIGPF